MQRLHRFEIHYRLHGRPYQFEQHDTVMTDADAWYYAALHSGTGLRLPAYSDGAFALYQQTDDLGLSDVSWINLTGRGHL